MVTSLRDWVRTARAAAGRKGGRALRGGKKSAAGRAGGLEGGQLGGERGDRARKAVGGQLGDRARKAAGGRLGDVVSKAAGGLLGGLLGDRARKAAGGRSGNRARKASGGRLGGQMGDVQRKAAGGRLGGRLGGQMGNPVRKAAGGRLGDRVRKAAGGRHGDRALKAAGGRAAGHAAKVAAGRRGGAPRVTRRSGRPVSYVWYGRDAHTGEEMRFLSAIKARASPQEFTVFRRATTPQWVKRADLPQRGPTSQSNKSKIVKSNRLRSGEWRIGGERECRSKYAGWGQAFAFGRTWTYSEATYAGWRGNNGHPRRRRAAAMSRAEGEKWLKQGAPPLQGPQLKSAYVKKEGPYEGLARFKGYEGPFEGLRREMFM